jgi:hypothetical protein
MQVQTINFSIPVPLLQMIDMRARAEARTRSGLIQEALRNYLALKTSWEGLFAYGRQQAKLSGLKAKDLEKIIDDYRVGR